jgi:hypothetical protein
VALEWLPLDQLSAFDFYPKAIIPHLVNYFIRNEKTKVYVGGMG